MKITPMKMPGTSPAISACPMEIFATDAAMIMRILGGMTVASMDEVRLIATA